MKTATLSLSSTPAAAHTARQWLRRTVEEDLRLCWSIDWENIGGALGEVVCNAVIHGGCHPLGRDEHGCVNQCGGPTGDVVRVNLSYCERCGQVTLEVRDMGRGFEVPERFTCSVEECSGRGLFMASKAVDSLTFRRDGPWWTCRMKREMPPPG